MILVYIYKQLIYFFIKEFSLTFGMWADGPHDIKNAHHNLIRMLFFLSFCFLLIKKDKNLHSFKFRIASKSISETFKNCIGYL